MRIKCGINAKSSEQSTQYTVNTYTIQLIFVWLERSGGLTKTLKRDSYARPLARESDAHYHLRVAFIQAAEPSFVPCSPVIPDGLPLTECHKNYITEEFGLRAC